MLSTLVKKGTLKFMVRTIKYTRRASHEVVIGGYKIGGNNPIAVQSMTNTPTADIEASVAQTERIERAVIEAEK